MKQTLLLISLVILSSLQAQTFDWVRTFGGNSNDAGKTIVVDDLGNVYSAGGFQGTADLDPDTSTFNLTSNGGSGYDMFVQKLDKNGNFIWAISFGGTSSERIEKIILDNSGNIILVGWFWGTVDFDPGPGVSNLTSNGALDIFVMKLDSVGNFLWARNFGGPTSARGISIDTDAAGNIYSTGRFYGTADFDPGAAVFSLTAIGNQDAFLHKMDGQGNFLWAKTFGGTGYEGTRDIKVDDFGNVYLTGEFDTTVDFDPGPQIVSRTSEGNRDIFILKLTSTGEFRWVQTMGRFSADIGHAICLDAFGNVYTSGAFKGTVDFDPGAGTDWHSANGDYDIFIHKSDTAGNYQWVLTMGGQNQSNDEGLMISSDSDGSIYTSGLFQGTIDFDPDTAGVFNLTNIGTRDVFLQKVDSSGALDWAISYGGNSNSAVARAIHVIAPDSVYMIGDYTGAIDFNPGPGTEFRGSLAADIYILKLSPCGVSNTTDVIDACSSYTWIDGVTYFSSNSTSTFALTDSDGCDSIISLDLTIRNSTLGTDVISSCNSYTWINGVTYTSSNNTASDTLLNNEGCDSIVILDLTINSPSLSTDQISACGSYTWIDGITYTSSNSTATDTLINSDGCDSIVTLDLTILSSNYSIDIISACNSYTWIDGITYTGSNNSASVTLTNINGCDSIVTLNLTINFPNSGTDVISACNSYTWIDGNTYASSNNSASYILSNSNGCDSVVTLDLTINSVSDISTSLFGITINANNTQASYQWLDCNNGFSVISGAIGQTFTATSNGSYAVQLSENGCLDTSACVAINNIGLSEVLQANQLRIFPNPTEGVLTISSAYIGINEVKILNSIGTTVLISRRNSFDISFLTNGFYLAEIEMLNGDIHYRRVIKY